MITRDLVAPLLETTSAHISKTPMTSHPHFIERELNLSEQVQKCGTKMVIVPIKNPYKG